MKTKFKSFKADDNTMPPVYGSGSSKYKDHKHPYLKGEFWLKECNQFWNTDRYSQKSKDYFNQSLGIVK